MVAIVADGHARAAASFADVHDHATQIFVGSRRWVASVFAETCAGLGVWRLEFANVGEDPGCRHGGGQGGCSLTICGICLQRRTSRSPAHFDDWRELWV